tara:strand:+ start:1363 stop:1533 length:171 start_codon:yes stop_codon:yes gene_type:complete
MKITINTNDVKEISQDETKEYTTIILHEGCNGLSGIIQVHNSCVVYVDDEQLTIES